MKRLGKAVRLLVPSWPALACFAAATAISWVANSTDLVDDVFTAGALFGALFTHGLRIIEEDRKLRAG